MSNLKTILGSGTLLIVVAGAGYYYWHLESSLNQALDTDYYETDRAQFSLLYRHSTHGVEMKYPSSWELNQPNQDWGTIAKFTPQKSESLLVVPKLTIKVEKSPQSKSLDEYTTNTVYLITQLPQAKILDSRPIQFDHKPAHKVIYFARNPDNNEELKNLQIWIFNGDRIYTLTFQASIDQYDNYAESVENEMFPSVKITSEQ
ncbi:PsbP-related protein [Pleurocapsa sp. PCC 7319]|uniref:PsbP-related protein n=1 Tax=Pleurocapsa sp. PCC 7319 TaxID=118161 RepID=UPI00034B8DA7|nr:PsbP-related protein [Pleurocapsa sp. PCC 7319]